MNDLEKGQVWTVPQITDDIRFGDMPGDKVSINEEHIRKANLIFPELLPKLTGLFCELNRKRAVVAVCGGSGVGKSEIASLLSYYLQTMGIGSYTLSGDNYPYRIPFYNDAERLRIFRLSGLKALIANGVYTEERFQLIRDFQRQEDDANPVHAQRYPWFAAYLSGGREGLKTYLGTSQEINFPELEAIVSEFKQGKPSCWLKRMGREETEIWYEEVDFRNTNVMIIEWTHGNSNQFGGVDIPVLLNSTPQETLAHRQARNRDGKTDSAFTMTVLELEQEMLIKQSYKAKIIVSKQGELLTYGQYLALMGMPKESANG